MSVKPPFIIFKNKNNIFVLHLCKNNMLRF